MSSSKRNRAYVEHCLCSVECLVRDGDLELAGLTLDFAHPDLGSLADQGQAERLKVVRAALGRGEPDVDGEGAAPSGFGLH